MSQTTFKYPVELDHDEPPDSELYGKSFGTESEAERAIGDRNGTISREAVAGGVREAVKLVEHRKR